MAATALGGKHVSVAAAEIALLPTGSDRIRAGVRCKIAIEFTECIIIHNDVGKDSAGQPDCNVI